jgi:hypothetical protein
MANERFETGCKVVGEFFDEMVSDKEVAAKGVAVPPDRIVVFEDAMFEDVIDEKCDLRDFQVLLKEGRTALVRGHGLKHELDGNTNLGTYSILLQTPSREVEIAVFNAADVIGIFEGELRRDLKSA